MRLIHPDELTQVSDSGDKSAGSRFERCLQRPQRGEAQGWAEYTSAANNAAASRTKETAKVTVVAARQPANDKWVGNRFGQHLC